MILLDSHVIVWMLTDQNRLSATAHEAILRARTSGDALAYSPVSLYEIANAVRRGRLPLRLPVADFIASIENRLECCPLNAEIALKAAELPSPFHGDPMDRLITATALVMDCPLLTHDHQIRNANLCKLIW